MPINVRCPQGHALAVAEKYAGRRVKCPRCQSVLDVPGTDGPVESTKNGSPKPPPLPKTSPWVAENPPIAPPVAKATLAGAPPRVVEKLAGVQGYRPERSRVHTVYWLGLGLFALVLFQLAPALRYWNLATAPDWARYVMMLAVVQLGFAIWMTSLPDWSTVRVTMFVLAGVATLYGVTLGIAALTSPTNSLPFDMDDVRDKVRLWSAAVLLLVCLMTYICGRVGFRWRKSYWLEK
jgi:phage FluMu protein Com